MLLESFLNEVHSISPEDMIVTRRLQDMHIQGCNACDLCKRIKQLCVLKDDMAILYPLIKGADTLVLSTPVYWWGISAQLKTFIDRWYALDEDTFKGKKLYLIATGEDEAEGSGYRLIQEQFQEICSYLHMDFAGYLPIQADKAKPVSSNQPALLAARALAHK
jgi:multimeric flavodoxin WrbA